MVVSQQQTHNVSVSGTNWGILGTGIRRAKIGSGFPQTWESLWGRNLAAAIVSIGDSIVTPGEWCPFNSTGKLLLRELVDSVALLTLTFDTD